MGLAFELRVGGVGEGGTVCCERYVDEYVWIKEENLVYDEQCGRRKMGGAAYC